jgi:hypothetical protein
MSVCLPVATRTVVFREVYPDGLRDTLACGHVVYATSLREVSQRLCLLCLRSRKPRSRGREGRPPTTEGGVL